MRNIHRASTLATGTALLLALGCASTTPDSEPMTPEPAAASEFGDDSGAVEVVGEVSADLDPIYFGTDSSLLSSESREALKRHAEAIVAHPEWGVLRIEGHCDERGSEEYNLALGEGRAKAVQRYLTTSGVPASRLSIRTYGESMPAVAGHGEQSWRYNRRSELVVESLASAGR
jgi:peptidoglycan-associated lipoprotein